MKKIVFIFLFFSSFYLSSQTISPQVINSAGNSYTNSVGGVFISDNVGEPFTETISGNNSIITQGFLQPLTSAIASLSIIKNDVSCKDKKDGNISVSISNIAANSQVKYIWTPSITCNCNKNDSLIAGTYSLLIIITRTIQSGTKSDTLRPAPTTINDLNGPCRIKVYSLITPNGDNSNDAMFIENISEFPNNHVAVYNRWGLQLYEAEGYDNINKFWPRKEDGDKLASSTYFYVIRLGDGTRAIKGWVELIKN